MPQRRNRSFTKDGFKATTAAPKPRSEAASDQKSYGIDTVANVTTVSGGALLTDFQV